MVDNNNWTAVHRCGVDSSAQQDQQDQQKFVSQMKKLWKSTSKLTVRGPRYGYGPKPGVDANMGSGSVSFSQWGCINRRQTSHTGDFINIEI